MLMNQNMLEDASEVGMKHRGGTTSNRAEKDAPKQRRVYIMRHGERCDFALGKNWLEFLNSSVSKTSSASRQTIRRPNLNIPAFLPNRNAYELAKDPPLTEIGLFQAFKTGAAFAEAGVNIACVYSSPALRCIQTGVEFLRGLQGHSSLPNGPRIRIEAGLFEWCGWYKSGMPTFMTYNEIIAYNSSYPINPTYRSFFDANGYDVSESTEDYFRRTADITDAILANSNGSAEENQILLIGHAGSLYTCTRRLIGRGEVRGHNAVKHFKEMAAKVPYCGLCVTEEQPSTGNGAQRSGKWRLIEPPCPTFVHSANAPFDWTILS